MLLTQRQPTIFEGSTRGFHDYIPPTPPSNPRLSPAVTTASLPLPPVPKKSPPRMTTPHRGLGLPPPAGLTLPPPPERPPPPSISQPTSHGQLPAPPSQWQGGEESMRNWLQAKAEEDRRKQEEEKTKQESLRLEQRKIEQNMLHESLQGGVPPYMVPMIFAGLGGPNMANTSLEWTQHYMSQIAQLQQQQQQQQYQQQALPSAQASPELRRESRSIASITQSSSYVQPQGPGPVQSLPPPPQSTFVPPYPVTGMSPSERGRGPPTGPTSAPRPPPQSSLPRLNTAEMHIQPPPSAPGAHPLSQSQSSAQEQTSPSTSIYFHHWVPPQQSSQSGGNQPTTPSDSAASPRKRKAQGQHQPAPPPSSHPTYTSPPYSTSPQSTPRRRGHSRQRSDSSRGYEPLSRSSSSRRRRPTDPGNPPSTSISSHFTSSSITSIGSEMPSGSSYGGSSQAGASMSSYGEYRRESEYRRYSPPSRGSDNGRHSPRGGHYTR